MDRESPVYANNLCKSAIINKKSDNQQKEGKMLYHCPGFVLLQKPRNNRQEDFLWNYLLHAHKPHLINSMVQPSHSLRIRKNLPNERLITNGLEFKW